MDRSGKIRLSVGSLLLLAAVGSGVAFHHHDRPTALDSWFLDRLFIAQGNRPASAVTWLGSTELVALVVIVGACITFRRNPRRSVVFLIAPALAGVLVEYVGKPLVDRHLYGGPCFPSGHATGVISVALIVYLAAPRRWRPVAALADATAVVAVSVVIVGLGWHYPTDVLAGICLGAGVMLTLDGALVRNVPTK